MFVRAHLLRGVHKGAVLVKQQAVTRDAKEREASGQTGMLYGLAILVIFLCLAALYESWSIPLAVMLVVPLGMAGTALAAHVRGLENDLYFQVAILVVIAIAARNAILMVEFANQCHKSGQALPDAAREAARLRVRPIMMTAFTFGVGVLPLALSTGVGANSRVSIGTGALGGTLSSTFLSLVFVPVFFLIVTKLFARQARR